MSFPKIKICCISSLDEAQMAIDAGANALGLVSAMPSGPGVITEEQIAEIASFAKTTAETFLLTSLRDPFRIIEQHRRCKTTTIQICDELEKGAYPILKKQLDGVQIIQVIHVEGKRSVAEAAEVAPFVDAILLDSGRPNLVVKELGGTGRIHDWSISAEICQKVGKPVFLAGGLNSDNVSEALSKVRPYGVDICSGVRAAGKLDPEKLRKFVHRVRSIT